MAMITGKRLKDVVERFYDLYEFILEMKYGQSNVEDCFKILEGISKILRIKDNLNSLLESIKENKDEYFVYGHFLSWVDEAETSKNEEDFIEVFYYALAFLKSKAK